MISTTLRIRLAARLAALVGLRRIFTMPARLAFAWPRATVTVEAAAKPRVAMRAAEAPPRRRSLRATLLAIAAEASMRPALSAPTLSVRPLANAARVALPERRTRIALGVPAGLAPPPPPPAPAPPAAPPTRVP